MVPIHDTDVAEERWTKAEWEHYELWEKIEQRLLRRKRLWITATLVLFTLISAVPILKDRMPKWKSMTATRKLAQEINRLKRDANVDHVAYRIRFQGAGSLNYHVEQVSTCSSASASILVRSGSLVSESEAGKFAMLGKAQGAALGIPGLVEDFCYDFLAGSETAIRGELGVGFGIIPVNDLTEQRMDRLSVLLLSGSSAECSFE